MTEIEAGAPRCAECGASNEPAAAFCTQCGAKLIAAGSEAPATRRRPAGDAAERARGRHEFGRIKGIVLVVRSVFLVSAGTAAFTLLLYLGVGAALDADLLPIAIAMSSLSLLLCVSGAVLVVRAPLVWTTVCACSWTLDTALSLAWFSFSPRVAFCAFLVVAFWFAVAQAARIQRLMAADPTLQIVRKRIDASRRPVGGVRERGKERAQSERRARRRGRLRLFGIGLAVLVVGGVAIWLWTRPPAVGPTVEAFVARWSRGDAKGLAELWLGGEDERRARDLGEDLERRGWLPTPPQLGAATTAQSEHRAVATFASPAGPVRVDFGLRDSSWYVLGVSLPAFVTPDLGPAIETFRRAWSTPGSDALVALFRPASRDRLGSALRRMLEQRSWHEQRPELGDVDPGRPGQPRVRALFALGTDELSVTFEYWHPGWAMTGIGLPKE